MRVLNLTVWIGMVSPPKSSSESSHLLGTTTTMQLDLNLIPLNLQEWLSPPCVQLFYFIFSSDSYLKLLSCSLPSLKNTWTNLLG